MTTLVPAVFACAGAARRVTPVPMTAKVVTMDTKRDAKRFDTEISSSYGRTHPELGAHTYLVAAWAVNISSALTTGFICATTAVTVVVVTVVVTAAGDGWSRRLVVPAGGAGWSCRLLATERTRGIETLA